MYSSNNIVKREEGTEVQEDCKGEDIRLYKGVEGSGQEQRRSGTTSPPMDVGERLTSNSNSRSNQGTVVRYRRSKETIIERGTS